MGLSVCSVRKHRKRGAQRLDPTHSIFDQRITDSHNLEREQCPITIFMNGGRPPGVVQPQPQELHKATLLSWGARYDRR